MLLMLLDSSAPGKSEHKRNGEAEQGRASVKGIAVRSCHVIGLLTMIS